MTEASSGLLSVLFVHVAATGPKTTALASGEVLKKQPDQCSW
jgi:hypothetical protein